MLRARTPVTRLGDSSRCSSFHTQSIYAAPHSANHPNQSIKPHTPRGPPSIKMHSMPPRPAVKPSIIPPPIINHQRGSSASPKFPTHSIPIHYTNAPNQNMGSKNPFAQPPINPQPTRITPIDGSTSNPPSWRAVSQSLAQGMPPVPQTLNPFIAQARAEMQPFAAIRPQNQSYRAANNPKVQQHYARTPQIKTSPVINNPFAPKAAVTSFPEMYNRIKNYTDGFSRRAEELQRMQMAPAASSVKFAHRLEEVLRKTQLRNSRGGTGAMPRGQNSIDDDGHRQSGGFGKLSKQDRVPTKPQPVSFGFGSDSKSSSGTAGTGFSALKEEEEATDTLIEVPVAARQTVGRLAGQMGVRGQDVLAKLAEHGNRAKKVTDFINAEAAELVVVEFNMMPVRTDLEQKSGAVLNADDYASLPRRGAVVCVMGHVDHGKTTLLDTLRKERRALYEAGNITQSIGAFRVDLNLADEPADTNADSDAATSDLGDLDTIDSEASIATFLDTPGHAAFRAMRERGASSALTDLIVLVVSAVDGIQPQTVEVIELSKQHNVPMIVAINKCDLPDANPTRVKEQLCMYDIVPESMGGDILTVDISAKTGDGIQELKESILLASDMLDLRAPRDGLANAYVVESRRERGLGCVMNVVVRAGQLKVGDAFVCGLQHGTVRALVDEQGQKLPAALPGQAVQLIGATNLEDTTEDLTTVENEEAAIALVNQRKSVLSVADTDVNEAEIDEQAEQPKDAVYKVMKGRGKWRVAVKEETPEEAAAAAAREASTLYLVLKADVRGSLEALIDYVNKLPTDEVSVQVLRHSLGEITEADILYAADFKASIVGFNVSASAAAQTLARNKKVPITSKDIIYHCMDEIRDQASDKIPIDIEQRVIGQAEILQVFPQRKKRASDPETVIAGCRVKHGEIKHDQLYRVRRDNELIFQGSLRSMRHLKEEVQLMVKGSECGLLFDTSSTDFMAGDQVECVEEVQQKRQLDDSAARGFETVHNPKYDQTLTNEAREAIMKKKKKQAQELKGASTLVYAPANVKQRVQNSSR